MDEKTLDTPLTGTALTGTALTGTSPARELEPMLYCPVCSRRLAERKCKLYCEQCGYYMSCADYY